MSQSVVPVIDIAPFLAGGAEDKARVAAEVDRACREIGFLVISGHGVAQVQIDEMRRVTRAFFELPYWEKLRVKMPPDRYRGLMTVGSEDTAYSMDEEENAPDWRESFVIGPHDHDYDEYHYGPAGWRFFAANLWPDQPAGMRPLWEAYYREMERLGGRPDAHLRLCARPSGDLLRRQDRPAHHQLHRLLLPAADDTASCRASSAAAPMRTTAASPSSPPTRPWAACRC